MEQFIQDYLQRGWGSMNKNDFEVWIFNEVMKDPQFHDLKDFDLSVKLRIAQSKVKRLRYEASLKYPQPINYGDVLFELLRHAKFNADYIVFSIEDVATRQYLSNTLKKRGNFFDSSFNTEIVKISAEDLVQLLNDLSFDSKMQKDITDAINKNSGKDIPHLIIKALGEITSKVVGESTKELASLGLNSIVTYCTDKLKQIK